MGRLVSAVAAGGLVGSLAWTWRPMPSERAVWVILGGLIGVGIPLAISAAFSSAMAITAA